MTLIRTAFTLRFDFSFLWYFLLSLLSSSFVKKGELIGTEVENVL